MVNSIGSRDKSIRPIDLLHKLGNLTTPANVNMAQLSASWATRRYFWAIEESNIPQSPFRLSTDARNLDFHQKNLLSDEFGVAFAGLVLESEFHASEFVDISIALGDPEIYQDIRQRGRTQPDYLMWSEIAASPYYVVECKGSQSSRATSYDQLRRGLEQVPAIVFGAGARQVITLVVATCMEETGTTVFVVDPPPDEPSHKADVNKKSNKVSQRTGESSWEIRDPDEFTRRAWIAQESSLLKWAGQYREAAQPDFELEPWRDRIRNVPEDAPRERLQTELGVFVGTRTAAFPELCSNQIRIFNGVEEELLAMLSEGSPRAREIAQANQRRFREEREVALRGNPLSSISPNGTCMIVEGL